MWVQAVPFISDITKFRHETSEEASLINCLLYLSIVPSCPLQKVFFITDTTCSTTILTIRCGCDAEIDGEIHFRRLHPTTQPPSPLSTRIGSKVARWQNLIPSFPWIAPGWRAWGRNPKKGRDQILQRSVAEP